MIPLFNLIDQELSNTKKVINLHKSILNNQDLFVPQYTLPNGFLPVIFKLSIKHQENQYSSNRFKVYLLISFI